MTQRKSAAGSYAWQFLPRFRRKTFGWKSQPAISRIKEAVAEIKKVAKKDAVIGAEGAVVFLERVSPALEQVDSSSGSIGTAVNNAIAQLVPIIASAGVDVKTRDQWLDRLFEAHAADQIPYIERLADYWGELCGSPEVASGWADRLIDLTRLALSPDPGLRGHFHATSACLSSLYSAGRYDEMVALVEGDLILWDYKQWAVKALAAQGRTDDAIRYAESCRSPWASDQSIDYLCEGLLLASGRVDEAYARYGVTANRAGTYLATFRAVAKKYPLKEPGAILADLVASTPGDEGKWFAAAKDAGLYDEALALASRAPCDPKTLGRAARDYVDEQPDFALGAGQLSLHWFVQGYGYDVTGYDVRDAFTATLAAADRLGRGAEVRERLRSLVAAEARGGFVRQVLGRELGL